MIAGICGPEPAAAPDRAAAAVTGNALGCAVPRPVVACSVLLNAVWWGQKS